MWPYGDDAVGVSQAKLGGNIFLEGNWDCGAGEEHVIIIRHLAGAGAVSVEPEAGS